MVAEVNHYVWRAPSEVRPHRFERTDVPVNIGDDGDSHDLPDLTNDMITDRLDSAFLMQPVPVQNTRPQNIRPTRVRYVVLSA